MNNDYSAVALLKSFLTKACFTVGLCTTAYWSVAKIHRAMNPERSESVVMGQSAANFERVAAATQPGIPVAHAVAASLPLNKIDRDAPAAAPSALAAASPTVAPSAPGDATASNSPSAETPPLNQQVITDDEPVPHAEAPAPFYPNPYAYQAPSETKSDKLGETGGDSSDRMPGAVGTTVTGVMGNGPAVTGQVFGAINIAQNNTAQVVSNLTSQDRQWLLASTVQASVPAEMFEVQGVKSNHEPVTFQVHSSRWNYQEGVKAEATFAIRAGSGNSPVQFDVEMKILTANAGVEHPVQFILKPNDSNARNDIRDGRAVRIYTFKFQNVPVRNNTETLHAASVILEYETQGGVPVLTHGKLAFHRTNVKTNGTPWTAGPTSNPADDVIVGQLPFSMKLEKSP